MAKIIKLIENRFEETEELPLFEGKVPVSTVIQRKSAQKFVRTILLNPHVSTILGRLNEFEHKTWLTAGCLAQTLWNLLSGRNPENGIDDYDLIYFDEDTSWEAEDDIIRFCNDLFSDLDIQVQIRNQARVPIWYEEKFGLRYPPVKAAQHAVLRFPSRATAIAVSTDGLDDYCLYAPFGFKDTWEMLVRPNPRLDIADVYHKKATRWAEIWPQLRIEPWVKSAL